jgi:hypothetical protein
MWKVRVRRDQTTPLERGQGRESYGARAVAWRYNKVKGIYGGAFRPFSDAQRCAYLDAGMRGEKIQENPTSRTQAPLAMSRIVRQKGDGD